MLRQITYQNTTYSSTLEQVPLINLFLWLGRTLTLSFNLTNNPEVSIKRNPKMILSIDHWKITQWYHGIATFLRTGGRWYGCGNGVVTSSCCSFGVLRTGAAVVLLLLQAAVEVATRALTCALEHH
jgi:hypothetical protein